MIRSVLHIEAPRDQVFAVLTDYPRYREWFPGCEHSAVVAKMDGSVEAEFVINIVRRVRIGMRFVAQPSRTLSFRMIKGRDLRSYSGSYRLADSADGRGTTLIAEMRVELNSFVPGFVVSHFARRSMDETGASLKRHLERVVARARMNQHGLPMRETGA